MEIKLTVNGVTRSDEVITTVLGSCIAACIRDPATHIGGMNHFMLPEDSSTGKSSWIDGPGGKSMPVASRYWAAIHASLPPGARSNENRSSGRIESHILAASSRSL